MVEEFGGATMVQTVVECWLMALEMLPLLVAYEMWEAGRQTAAPQPLWSA